MGPLTLDHLLAPLIICPSILYHADPNLWESSCVPNHTQFCNMLIGPLTYGSQPSPMATAIPVMGTCRVQ
eukprot:6951553-Karenia_brevis.AAC.1